MGERQALDDLLAAINSNPNSEQSDAYPNVSPMPNVPISQFSDRVVDNTQSNPLMPASRQVPARRQPSTQRTTPAAHVPSAQQVSAFHQGRSTLPPKTKNDNLLELENLLGSRPSSSSAPRQTNATSQQVFKQPPVSHPAVARRLQLGGAYAPGGANPNITAGLTRQQQLANVKALQRQHAATVATASSAARQTAASMQRSTPAQRVNELAAGIARNTAAANAARSQNQHPSNSNAAQRQPPHRNPQPGQARQPQPQQGRSITQEQIIVGHFCRHAIKTLARVMQNNPRAKEAEAQLKDHIKTVWAKWVKQIITRPQLLESVANCVRSSCDAAAQIDVIREFKSWYEREYELQRQRTSMMDPKDQARQAAQRRNSVQNTMAAMRAQAAVSAGASGRGSAAIRTPQGNRAMLAKTEAVPASAAGRGSAAIRTPPGSRAMLAKAQAQTVPSTGGKRVASKTIPEKPVGAGRGVAGKTLAGRGAGRGVAGKSLGGKSVPQPMRAGGVTSASTGRGQAVPRPGVGRGTAVGKVPMLGRGVGIGKSPTIGRGTAIGHGAAVVSVGIGSGGAVGGKGLLSNKSPAVSKTKAPRKSPTKPASKVSPKTVAAKQKPPPANPAAFVTSQGQGVAGMVGSVVGKRPLEQSGAVPHGPLAKKAKTPPTGSKGPVARKKPSGLPGQPSVQKGKPPPARPDMFKGKHVKKPGQPVPTAQAANAMGKGLLPGQAAVGQPPLKKPRRADDGMDELSVVNNIVDIEDEEDKLGIDAGGDAPEVQEVFDYGADMLLAGPRLREKMQTVTKRFGLDGSFGTDIMEMLSLAARERLAMILESLREVASIRTDKDKDYWKIRPNGPNMYERFIRMRQDEQRSLQVAAEMRVKRRKEQMEQEAKKLAGDNASTDKKTKDSSAAAEAERKEKLALEKKRKEHSSQRDALSALVRSTDARRKKPTTSKGLAPLEQLGKKGLPPIPKLGSAGGTMSAGTSSKDGKMPDPLEKLNALGPLVKLGRANDPRNMEPQSAEKKEVVKRRLTLRDCLFLMEKEPHARKSSLVYKWYARLGTRDEK